MRRETRARRRPRRNLEWVASHTHTLEANFTRARWPPFYGVSGFLPRIKVELKNAGEELGRCSVDTLIRPYGGPISQVGGLEDGWVDTEHTLLGDQWSPGHKKRFTVAVRGRSLAGEGPHVMRFQVVRWIPQGTHFEELNRQLRQAEVSPEQRKQLLERSISQLEASGIDPHRLQPGSFRAETVFKATLVDYFRIEPFSSVLTFWMVAGTLLVALATLGLTFVTLGKH